MKIDLTIEEISVLSKVLEDYKRQGFCNRLSLSDDVLLHNIIHKIDNELSL